MKSLKNLFGRSVAFTKRNSSTILAGTAVVGLGLTVYSSIRATFKTSEYFRYNTRVDPDNGGPAITVEDKIFVAKTYAPAALLAFGTAACIICSDILNRKQQRSMAVAYAMLDAAYKNYREDVRRIFGQEADNQIMQEAEKRSFSAQDVFGPHMNEQSLFYEEHYGEFFQSTLKDVTAAQFHICRDLAYYGEATLNSFYGYLNIPYIDEGDVIGWESSQVDPSMMDFVGSDWLDIVYTPRTMEDGLEYYTIEFTQRPVPLCPWE